eukprot:33066-Pyramimonas_sp.AAC.2
MFAGPEGREVVGESGEVDTEGENRGWVSGVLSAPSLPLLAQKDPQKQAKKRNSLFSNSSIYHDNHQTF